MGITVTNNVEHYLQHKETNQLKKMTKLKTSEAKKDKNKRKYELLKQHTRTAKMEFTKCQGTYQSGMNMDDPFGELLNGGEAPPAAKRTKTTTRKYCPFCGKTGHMTPRTKNCKEHDNVAATVKYRSDNGSLLTAVAPPQEEQEAPVQDEDIDLLLALAANPSSLDDDDAAADCERFDALPFDADVNDDESEESIDFHDAQTWDTDDESEQGADIEQMI
jgi:hypothetical protein